MSSSSTSTTSTTFTTAATTVVKSIAENKLEDFKYFDNNLSYLGEWTVQYPSSNRKLQLNPIVPGIPYEQNLNPNQVLYTIYGCPTTQPTGLKIGLVAVSLPNYKTGFYTPHIQDYLTGVEPYSPNFFGVPSLDQLDTNIVIVPLTNEKSSTDYGQYMCAAYDTVYDDASFNGATNNNYEHLQFTLEFLFSGLNLPVVYIFLLIPDTDSSDNSVNYELLLPAIQKYGVTCIFTNTLPNSKSDKTADYLKNLTVPFFVSVGNSGPLLRLDKILRSTYATPVGQLFNYNNQGSYLQVGDYSSTGGFYSGTIFSEGVSISQPDYETQLSNFPGNYIGQTGTGKYYAVPMASCLGGYYAFYTRHLDTRQTQNDEYSGKWVNSSGTSISVILMAMIYTIYSVYMEEKYYLFMNPFFFKNFSSLFTYVSESFVFQDNLADSKIRGNPYYSLYQWNPLSGFGYPNVGNWQAVIQATLTAENSSSGSGSSSTSGSTSTTATTSSKKITVGEGIGIAAGTTIAAGTVAAAVYYKLKNQSRQGQGYERISSVADGIELTTIDAEKNQLVSDIMTRSTKDSFTKIEEEKSLRQQINTVLIKLEDSGVNKQQNAIQFIRKILKDLTPDQALAKLTELNDYTFTGEKLVALVEETLSTL